MPPPPHVPPVLDLSFLYDRAALKRIAAVTLACAALAGLYALLAPKWFRSVLTVVPAKAQRGGGGISSLLGAELGGLAGGFGIPLGGGADVPRIAAVLQSISVSDAVIEKFDLRSRYGKKYQESARDALWAHCDVKTLAKPNLVQLSCEDEDPRFVQQLLSYFADYGNQVFQRVGVSSAAEEVRFLEKRIAELRQQADDASARLREFQEKHRIVDIDSQAKAIVSALAALQSQRIGKQLELGYARTFSAGDEATLRQLRSQLAVMDQKVRDLEEPPEAPGVAAGQDAQGKDANRGMFPPALLVPQLRAEFEKLYRDRKVSEVTLVYALERLEAAKADEARDVSTFLVLDPPALPTHHSRPKRILVVVGGSALGFLASLAYEWWRRRGGAAAILRIGPSLQSASARTSEPGAAAGPRSS
jgi:capsule polysaccharide export protein KpsE/RkpR